MTVVHEVPVDCTLCVLPSNLIATGCLHICLVSLAWVMALSHTLNTTDTAGHDIADVLRVACNWCADSERSGRRRGVNGVRFKYVEIFMTPQT